jgi:serine/threonine protein kinase
MPDPDQTPDADSAPPDAASDEPRIDDAMAEAMLGAAHDPVPEDGPQPPTIIAGSQTAPMSGGMGGMWQPPSIEEAARLFPNYEVLGLLGRGGMGAVYKARQIELDRLVAIKLLPLEISVDADFADRFRREARAMAKLNHPNIITVHEFGKTSAGHLFFAMEFVDGANLHAIIHGPGLTPPQALAITIQVCEALAFAHEQGVVHRDIKPANVMVDQRSRAKVADFGLARLTDPSAEQMGHTMTGTVMGTPDYMAPEQMKGMNVDHRADIYSLGVMLYEMLCKDVPRGFFDPPSVRVGADARLDDVVRKAMQQQPERRYQQTGEMRADVDQIHTSMVQPTPSLVAGVRKTTTPAAANERTTPSRSEGTPRKSKAKFISGLILVSCAIVGTILALIRPKPVVAPPAGTKEPATAATIHSVETLEPGAIRLFDSPDKLPKTKNVS